MTLNLDGTAPLARRRGFSACRRHVPGSPRRHSRSVLHKGIGGGQSSRGAGPRAEVAADCLPGGFPSEPLGQAGRMPERGKSGYATVNASFFEYYSANKEWLNMTLDHIIPKSKNGKDTASNLVACCFSCNASKRDKLKNDYVNTLKYTRLNSIKFGIDPDAIVDFTW